MLPHCVLGDEGSFRGEFFPLIKEEFADAPHLARRAPLPPAERDRVDLHQAFIEVALGDLLGLATSDAFVRAGRQELHYGAGRLVSIREKPNVRRDFDGSVVRIRLGPVVADAFLVQPTTDSAGTFDNRPDHRQALWGLHSSAALPGASNLDLFYGGYRRGQSPYALATGATGVGGTPVGAAAAGARGSPVDETRRTVGARW